MKTQKMLQLAYILFTIGAMIGCLKHLVLRDAWTVLAFKLIKDLAAAIGVFYLYRKSLTVNETSRWLRLGMMVSFMSDSAMVLLLTR